MLSVRLASKMGIPDKQGSQRRDLETYHLAGCLAKPFVQYMTHSAPRVTVVYANKNPLSARGTTESGETFTPNNSETNIPGDPLFLTDD
jgi:hypothetical protein